MIYSEAMIMPERQSSGRELVPVREDDRFTQLMKEIGLQVCTLVATVSADNPFNLVWVEGEQGKMVKEAVLREIGETALPDGVASSEGEQRHRTQEYMRINQFTNEFAQDQEFIAGVNIFRGVMAELEPFIQGTGKYTKDDKGEITIGGLSITADGFERSIRQDQSGLSIVCIFSEAYQQISNITASKKRGAQFMVTMIRVATTKYAGPHLKELAKLHPGGRPEYAWMVLRKTDVLIDKLKEAPLSTVASLA